MSSSFSSKPTNSKDGSIKDTDDEVRKLKKKLEDAGFNDLGKLKSSLNNEVEDLLSKIRKKTRELEGSAATRDAKLFSGTNVKAVDETTTAKKTDSTGKEPSPSTGLNNNRIAK